MITAYEFGTLNSSIGSEDIIETDAVEGKFTGVIDVSNMADGDVLELRAYQMVLTGETTRVVDLVILYGAQPADQLIIEWGKDLKNELEDLGAITYGIKQTHGTSRSYDWKIIRETATLSSAGIQAIWDYLISALTTVGSIGKLIVDFLDAAVSGRSSHSAADVWGVATRTLTSFDNVRFEKNTAFNSFKFFMRQSVDHASPATGLTVTATRSIDNGAFAACSNAVAEVGSGWYRIDLAASDLNGDSIALKFTATGADQRNILIVTQV